LEKVAHDPPTYVLRVHEAGGTFGDSYFGAATMTIEGTVAMTRGLVFNRGRYNRAAREAFVEALAAIGCTQIIGERLMGAKEYWVRIPLPARSRLTFDPLPDWALPAGSA
jgi:hypothetical protein